MLLINNVHRVEEKKYYFSTLLIHFILSEFTLEFYIKLTGNKEMACWSNTL